ANNDDWAVPCREPKNPDYKLWTQNPSFRKYVGYEMEDTEDDQWSVQTPKKYKCPSDRQKAGVHSHDAESDSTTGTLVSYGHNIEDWYPSRGDGSWANALTQRWGYKLSKIKQPAMKLHFNEGQDWWSKWGGADYTRGWDVLGQMGTVNDYKKAGCSGPTMYRHNESANLAFYDGHVDGLRKEKVWNYDDYHKPPYTPGMWVVNEAVWFSNGAFK
ncbi:MAG: hypothetical protein MI922_07620, partial [Bacteroidales bacterium]|nr:hypothetical protein [Bacteroidales bacterium]